MKDKYDQIKMELDTASQNIVNAENSDSKTHQQRKKIKKQQDPKTLSINTQYLDNEAEDALVSPKNDIFKKLAGPENDGDGYAKTFHDIDVNCDDDSVQIDETYKSSQSADRHFMNTFKISTGSQPIINVTEKTGQTSAEIETLQGDIRSDYYEFTDRLQRKEIIGMYKYAKKSIKIRSIFAIIFAFMLLLIENIGIFVKDLTGVLANPYVLTGANIVVFLACAAFAYEQLYHGIKSIFSKDYIPESVAVVATLCAIVYSLLTLIFIGFENKPRLYNFPVAMIIVFVLLYSYFNVKREKYGFSVVSSKDAKFYLEKSTMADDEAETETFGSTSKEFEGEIARLKRTAFVKGYFANTNTTPNLHSFLGVYFILSLLAPAVLAIISLFKGFDFFNATTVWFVGVLLMLPVGAFFSYSIPFLIANKRLYDDQVAIIGENAIGEFATTNVVSVNDTTAFPPYNVKLTNFQIFNGFKAETVLYYASSGFAAVGGPLSEVFESATKDAFQKSKKTKFVCSGRSYLCVKIDGDTIIFADRYGMSAQGIDVGSDKEEDEDISIMYMACNGILCSKMYLSYTMDEEFIKIANYLNKNKVAIGIRTFDPNINNELIKWQINQKRFDIRAIRLTNEDEVPLTTLKSEGRIVSKGQSKSLLKAIPVCKRIVKIRKATRALKILFSLIGISLVGLYIFGKIAVTASALIGGFYIILMASMAILTLVSMPSIK